MTIEIPDELTERIAQEAARRGITVEQFVLHTLRLATPRKVEPLKPGETLQDRLKPFIGCIDGPPISFDDMKQDLFRKATQPEEVKPA
jgi:hypothetical protein